MGKDHTLFALSEGHVEFRRKRGGRQYVGIAPVAGDVPPAEVTVDGDD